MVVLKAEPAQAIGSLDELMALAQTMEQQAAQRYAGLAERVRARGAGDLADLFARLAEAERHHVLSVERWSQQQLGKAPDPSDMRWIPPDTFDDEAAEELASSRLADAYRILSMAVRNEERAFLLWSHIAAQAETGAIREAAERMAHEELEHVALLRRARRQAYHAAGRPARPARSVTGRIAQAASGERRLAEMLAATAAASDGETRADALVLAAEARTMAAELAAIAGREGPAQTAPDDIATLAERLVEAYLDIADHSRDEAAVARIQGMARQAIRRLGWLRTAGAERHGSPR
jgi:rubrerythrin